MKRRVSWPIFILYLLIFFAFLRVVYCESVCVETDHPHLGYDRGITMDPVRATHVLRTLKAGQWYNSSQQPVFHSRLSHITIRRSAEALISDTELMKGRAWWVSACVAFVAAVVIGAIISIIVCCCRRRAGQEEGEEVAENIIRSVTETNMHILATRGYTTTLAEDAVPKLPLLVLEESDEQPVLRSREEEGEERLEVSTTMRLGSVQELPTVVLITDLPASSLEKQNDNIPHTFCVPKIELGTMSSSQRNRLISGPNTSATPDATMDQSRLSNMSGRTARGSFVGKPDGSSTGGITAQSDADSHSESGSMMTLLRRRNPLMRFGDVSRIEAMRGALAHKDGLLAGCLSGRSVSSIIDVEVSAGAVSHYICDDDGDVMNANTSSAGLTAVHVDLAYLPRSSATSVEASEHEHEQQQRQLYSARRPRRPSTAPSPLAFTQGENTVLSPRITSTGDKLVAHSARARNERLSNAIHVSSSLNPPEGMSFAHDSVDGGPQHRDFTAHPLQRPPAHIVPSLTTLQQSLADSNRASPRSHDDIPNSNRSFSPTDQELEYYYHLDC